MSEPSKQAHMATAGWVLNILAGLIVALGGWYFPAMNERLGAIETKLAVQATVLRVVDDHERRIRNLESRTQ